MVLEPKSRGNTSSLTYTIQNIVVKSRLDIEENLDLLLLSENLKNAQYDKDRFPGLFTRFNHPKSAIIIFRNGKLILTGLKSFSHVDLIIERLILRLNEINSISLKKGAIDTQVVNIVVTADFARIINLDSASIILNNAIYEPEVFPGLSYKISAPVKAVFLIFSTGKIVLTGIRMEKDIEPVLAKLGRLLEDQKLFRNG
ncbi:MAG: TATA-box-binding protein [Candidatus Lokiarchaeota archaeon]|nr:TATA-box-binding protein [Candidatus Lokiarchaeota archaeon]